MSSVTRYQSIRSGLRPAGAKRRRSEDKTIMLNVALAWLRLARQIEAGRQDEAPPTAPDANSPS